MTLYCVKELQSEENTEAGQEQSEQTDTPAA